LARAGLLDEAKEAALKTREAALGIESSYARSKALVSAVDSLAQAGLLDEAKEAALKAKEVALGIKDPEDRFKALVSAVDALARAGLLDEAKEAALKTREAALGIESSYARSKALVSAVDALARAGLADRAYDIAKQIYEVEERSRALASVAKARARKQEFRRARRIAGLCDLPNHRLDAFTTILSEYTKRKKPELANVLGKLEEPETSHND